VPAPTGDVRTLDPDSGAVLWESNPANGTWYDFPGGQGYFFALPGSFQVVDGPYAWVSTEPNPYSDDAGGTYVLAGGQLAEFSSANGGSDGGLNGFAVNNATCAHYYLRVSMLGIIPLPAPAPPVDAGNDAPGDAPADGPGDGDAGTGD
jgi:hypothetical protein